MPHSFKEMDEKSWASVVLAPIKIMSSQVAPQKTTNSSMLKRVKFQIHEKLELWAVLLDVSKEA